MTRERSILTSDERYEEKSEAKSDIQSLKKSALDDSCYERATSNWEEPYFMIKNRDGKWLARSVNFSSGAEMENAVESFKRDAPEAEVLN